MEIGLVVRFYITCSIKHRQKFSSHHIRWFWSMKAVLQQNWQWLGTVQGRFWIYIIYCWRATKSHNAIFSISSTFLQKYLCSMLKFSKGASANALRRLVATQICCNIHKLLEKFYHFVNQTLIGQVIFKFLPVFTIRTLKFSWLSSSFLKYGIRNSCNKQ